MHHDTRALRLACPSGLLTTIREAREKAGVEFTNGNKPGAATPHEGLLWQVPVGGFEAPGRCAQNAPAARREAPTQADALISRRAAPVAGDVASYATCQWAGTPVLIER